MDQKDSIIVVVMTVAFARLLLVVSLIALYFFCRCQALMLCIVAGMDQIDSYAVCSHQGHILPCRGAEANTMVGIPQLPYIWWSMFLLCSLPSLSWRRGISHGPDCSADHSDSPVTLGQGGQCHCYAGVQAVRQRL